MDLAWSNSYFRYLTISAKSLDKTLFISEVHTWLKYSYSSDHKLLRIRIHIALDIPHTVRLKPKNIQKFFSYFLISLFI